MSRAGLAVALAVLAACTTTRAPNVPAAPAPAPAPVSSPTGPASNSHLPALPAAGSGRGGYYQDDGPGERPPEGLLELPDAVPKVESYSQTGNKPYVVFGKTYTPMLDDRPFKQRGTGSWYGKKFHGQKTSSGEPYDMYKLTAAHPTLPIPSYARVTNLNNGAQVIVRINDRGPFHSDRIIDLSYTAALKLGYLGKGSSELEVERLLPEDIARMNSAKPPAVINAPATSTATAPVEMQTSVAPVAAVPAMEKETLSPGPAPTTDVTTPASGFYLQIGAYAEAGNAEAARSRLQQAWDNALPPLQVYFVGLFYRLHSGPYATRDDALSAAQKMLSLVDVKPLVVQH